MKILTDCSIKIGVKYQNKAVARTAKTRHIIDATTSLDLIYLLRNLNTGKKINANKIPITTERSIGFITRNAKITTIAKITVVAIFLKYGSFIFYHLQQVMIIYKPYLNFL